MIRKGLALSLAMVMALSFTACATDEKKEKETSVEETTTVASEVPTAPGSQEIEKIDENKCHADYYGEVTLADYSEFVLYEKEYNVTGEELDAEMNNLLASYATYEDTDETVVTETSVVMINYEGYIDVDGAPYQFEGGTAEDQQLDIANSAYIEGFAEGLVGAKVGETTDLKLTFPDAYSGTTKDAEGNSISLAGRDVTFKVTVNSIKKKTVPELTDEFVKEKLLGMFDGDSAEALIEYFNDQIRIGKIVDTTALNDYVDKCEVVVNEEQVEAAVEDYFKSLNTSLESQSMSMEDYLKNYLEGQSEEEFRQLVYDDYIDLYKTYGVVCAVVEEAGKTITQERYEEIVLQYAKRMGYTDAVSYISYYESSYSVDAESYLPLQLTYQEAICYLADKGSVLDGERPKATEEE